MERPGYFEEIRAEAARHWSVLESDPALAGPWRQLFRQVQSPRHVLSELLQNADDAEATEASVRIEDGRFVFEHNGRDFTDADFHSLCRFGLSNKRILWTIGFRGVGFKSAFSLGDCVEIYTPTLAVRFHASRFTLPEWIDGTAPPEDLTRICIRLNAGLAASELEKNLNEWKDNPLSLLFFRHIRRLNVNGSIIEWQELGPGPVTGSRRVRLVGQDEELLLIRSPEEHFPAEAVEEIRQEQPLLEGDERSFPPCAVELIAGAEGRLYVVLPTGVTTSLPFACNAPFIQDPARLKIKDPEISPTNRWLLERVGKLAAVAMLEWLNRADLPSSERAAAYCLMPAVVRRGDALVDAVEAQIEQAFDEAIRGKPVLLTEEGRLVPADQAVILPKEILGVWPGRTAGALFDSWGRPPLSREIKGTDYEKLVRKKLAERIEKPRIVITLRSTTPPKPASWERLAALWVYLERELTTSVWGRYDWVRHEPSAMCVLPVRGDGFLHPAAEVVRLPQKGEKLRDEDIEFLLPYLKILDPDWIEYVGQQRERAKESEHAAAVVHAFEYLGLNNPTNVSSVIERAAESLFQRGDPSLEEAVRLTQLAARLNADLKDDFRFQTRDGQWRPASEGVLYDPDGRLEELLPPDYAAQHLLHPAYTEHFAACSPREWEDWIASGRAAIYTMPPLRQTCEFVWGRERIKDEARVRGLKGDLRFPYLSNEFEIQDWDFDAVQWDRWEELARSDASLWVEIGRRLLSQPQRYWEGKDRVTFIHVAINRYKSNVTSEPLPPRWALRLRDLPCLPDTYGRPALPCELARRTKETEPVMGVERFIDHDLDKEATRPLLDALGVRTKPLGPEAILERLRALARATDPPQSEVEKWYRRLDSMLDSLTTEQAALVRDAFRSEPLILSEDGAWVSADNVCLKPEGSVPGWPVIRSAVRDLMLWRRLGVEETCTLDQVSRWLASLPVRETLPADLIGRLRAILARYPSEIANARKHWLDLAGEWVPLDELEFALAQQVDCRLEALFDWVKRKTADLTCVANPSSLGPPFDRMADLCQNLEYRPLTDASGADEKKEWLRAVARCLQHLKLDDPALTTRVRALAERLERTAWREVDRLQVQPFLKGQPAGLPRDAQVVWSDERLLVVPLPRGKQARLVPEEIARAFSLPELRGALHYCFERSPEEIQEYFEENFAFEKDEEEVQTVVMHTNEGGLEVIRAVWQPGVTFKGESSGQGPPSAPPLRLVDRFAKAEGFTNVSPREFRHSDGSCLTASFNLKGAWEHWDAGGQLVRCYFFAEGSLAEKRIKIGADLWALIQAKPELYALVTRAGKQELFVIPGAMLIGWVQQGKIKLAPAAYWLEFQAEDLQLLVVT
jgi:hypothetical protein